jgi:hypothetical protein
VRRRSGGKAAVRRSPYSIAYRVLIEDEIEIIAIVHGARNPGWWTEMRP